MNKIRLSVASAVAILLFTGAGCSSKGDSTKPKTYKVFTDHYTSGIFTDYAIGGEGDDTIWIDTIMYAKGHTFGACGDVSIWRGWYFDSICVGDDQILRHDSVGASALKLDLVTRHLTVDLGDTLALEKILTFLGPLEGFGRFSKSYERCLDAEWDEDHGLIKYMGEFTFTIDYADSRSEDADKINRFLCHMACVSENERVQIPTLSAFYAGYTPSKYYRPVYTGNPHDTSALADFVAHKTFENWIRSGNYYMGSNAASIAIRSHVINPRFATFSKYEYEREGMGHGMYTETFHTLDLRTGKELRNKDIFKPNTLYKVKSRLFEIMAADPRYLEWHQGVDGPEDVEGMIEAWNTPLSILEGTEWEEPENEVGFELSDGALAETGVIFSFQPYEIDCWAAGAYNFIVPYSKLYPYLTPEAKQLLKFNR